MDEVELDLLGKLYEKLFIYCEPPSAINFEVILDWHHQWLGNVYSWAGRTRTSNIGKGGFQFASPNQFDHLIKDFQRNFLREFSEINALTREQFVQYISESHVEFILIHPVRDGNGRLSRLLIDMLAQKAGFGPLDYSLWDQNKDFYFRSIQAGLNGDYQHLKRLVNDVLPD
ncbi:MAG: Fic/DOC family protein [Aestuariibacter sp.]